MHTKIPCTALARWLDSGPPGVTRRDRAESLALALGLDPDRGWRDIYAWAAGTRAVPARHAPTIEIQTGIPVESLGVNPFVVHDWIRVARQRARRRAAPLPGGLR